MGPRFTLHAALTMLDRPWWRDARSICITPRGGDYVHLRAVDPRVTLCGAKVDPAGRVGSQQWECCRRCDESARIIHEEKEG